MADILYNHQTYMNVYTGSSSEVFDKFESGSLLLSEIIVDNELRFGVPISNRFECKVYEDIDIEQQNIEVLQTIDNVDTPIFKGKVESALWDRSHTYKSIVAYDDFYWKSSVNIGSWWETFWANKENDTLRNIRKSLISYIGLSELSPNDILVNDSMTCTKTISITNMSFAEMLRQILELSGVFPNITREGQLEYISLGNNTIDITSEYETNNSEFESYTTHKITGIHFTDSNGDSKRLIGTNVNAYTINGNIFIFELTTQQLDVVGNNLLNAVKDITYTPSDVNMIVSNLSYKLGTKLHTEQGDFYIFENEYSGVQLVEQHIASYGSESLPEVRNVNTDFQILGQKIAKVNYDLEGLEIEFGDYAEQTDTRISVTEEQVAINVQDINTLQRQVSGEMETYTGDEQPLPSNSPANSWNDAEKARRIGTKYYCTDGTSWQWMSGMLAYGSNALIYGTTKLIYYYWKQIADSGVAEALQIAHEALQEANDVSQTLLTDYETTEDAHSYVQQTKQEILNGVSNTYATQTALQTVDGKFANVYTKQESNSLVEQTAQAINQSVSQNYSTKAEVGNLKVGGENLILNSLDYVGDTHFMYNSHLIYNNRLLVYNQKKLCY